LNFFLLSRAPLATFHDTKHKIIGMSYDEKRKILVTIGSGGDDSKTPIKIWDMSAILSL
jgi:hypothetical protein